MSNVESDHEEYDFYGNPPKTKEDLRKWLTCSLKNISADQQLPFEVEEETFVQEKGFRRAFHQHCVIRSLLTNEYLWWVFEPVDLHVDWSTFPKKRYATYESLLQNVIDDYYVLWKMDEHQDYKQ